MHYVLLHVIQMAAARDRGVVTQKATTVLLSLLYFVSLSNKRLEGPGNTKVCSFHRCMKIVNDKMLNKNLATSFTSTLLLVLLPAIQKSSLSLDAISKSFHYTNIGNFNIRYYYIINLKGFINYEQYQKLPL